MAKENWRQATGQAPPPTRKADLGEQAQEHAAEFLAAGLGKAKLDVDAAWPDQAGIEEFPAWDSPGNIIVREVLIPSRTQRDGRAQKANSDVELT
jgi:hypothetical protein